MVLQQQCQDKNTTRRDTTEYTCTSVRWPKRPNDAEQCRILFFFIQQGNVLHKAFTLCSAIMLLLWLFYSLALFPPRAIKLALKDFAAYSLANHLPVSLCHSLSLSFTLSLCFSCDRALLAIFHPVYHNLDHFPFAIIRLCWKCAWNVCVRKCSMWLHVHTHKHTSLSHTLVMHFSFLPPLACVDGGFEWMNVVHT